MKSFRELLSEVFLLESKIDDLKIQNPGLHHEIDKYAEADTSPTKKFVPWLVSQHKKGNVTPDHPDLHSVVQNFDRYKNLHGIQDHSSRSFQDVSSAVKPLIGGPTTKKEVAESGRELIHNSGDIQAYHIKTKEASQHFYGGGPEAGPTNTTWCVSARSKDCLFNQAYGPMYTIHAKGDPNSPYAIHPERNKITNRHNDGDRNIDQEIAKKSEIAKLKPAIDAIQKHHDPFKYHLKHNIVSDDDIDRVIRSNNESHKTALGSNVNSHIALQALNHLLADEFVLRGAVTHNNSQVAITAVNHPKTGYMVKKIAIDNPNPAVALAALNHPNSGGPITQLAAKHPDSSVALAAIKHPLATEHTITNAVQHPNEHVALVAIKHPMMSQDAIQNAVRNPNANVALAALKHPLANHYNIGYAIEHPNADVALAALHHKKVSPNIVNAAATHPDAKVAMAALKHRLAGLQTIKAASMHSDPDVVLAALNHHYSDEFTTIHAAKHPNPKVALAALTHPKSETATTWVGAEHRDPRVAMAAVDHPLATTKTYKLARYHNDPAVREAAENQLKDLE